MTHTVSDVRMLFPKAAPYAFLFENAHLLLLCFERDQAKFLFLIREQRDGEVVLDYPGRTFTERVMDAVEQIFLVQVQTDDDAEPVRYVLGSYFVVGSQPYGAYYPRDARDLTVVLFRIDGAGADARLSVPEGDEYERAARAFEEQHADFLAIRRLEGGGNA
ncbi:MAG: hypothetical protein IRZ33_00170 [Alicyclobacillaceae bacterium]|nr:hypothetical protein [Alicyclobacillaceae bacterium]